jgi:hypothetical protein
MSKNLPRGLTLGMLKGILELYKLFSGHTDIASGLPPALHRA